MEIRLRRKGTVITVQLRPDNIPSALKSPKGFKGIDLTDYSVIYAYFGRHGDKKAEELHSRAPGAIIVYEYEWRNGWGEGVLLPARFNPSRVRFYKSTAQEETEANEAREQASEDLRQEVLKTIPGVNVALGYSGVNVTPQQETFSSDSCWFIYAKSLGEVKAEVEKMKSFWKEWNERTLEILSRRGIHDITSIQLVFRDPQPPHRPNRRVGIGFFKKGDLYEKTWIILEKQGDVWVETRYVTGLESIYVEANL